MASDGIIASTSKTTQQSRARLLPALLKYHRWLAMVLLIPVLMWGLSGLTHPLMAHFFTTNAARTALPTTSLPDMQQASLRSLEQAHQLSGLKGFDQVQIVSINDCLHYQFAQKLTDTRPSAYQEAAPWPYWQYAYVPINCSTAPGALPQKPHWRYVTELARFYAGDHESPIREIQTITEYDEFYTSINRRLPVERVIFDRPDALTIYVDATTGQLAAVSDGPRDVLLWIFRNLHTWDFVADRHHPVRVLLLQVLIFLTLVMGVSGLLLYTLFYKKLYRNGKGRKGNARVHRTLGVLISLPLIGFATSGLHVVSSKYEQETHFAFQPPRDFKISEITQDILPLAAAHKAYQVSLTRLQEQPVWQLHVVEDDKKRLVYIDMQGNEVENGNERHAIELATAVSGVSASEIKNTEIRDAFGRDYPQVMKRLPVTRIAFGDDNGTRVFVETQTGLIAGQGTKADGLRSLHFMMLHKYRFLNGLGIGNRDLIMSALVIGILGVCLLGLTLLLKRSRRGKRTAG